jgi:hypothetical protein
MWPFGDVVIFHVARDSGTWPYGHVVLVIGHVAGCGHVCHASVLGYKGKRELEC